MDAMQDQVSIINGALELTKLISNTNNRLSDYEFESFREKPQPPQKQTVTVKYPKITTAVKFWQPILLVTLVFPIFPIIYYFCMYKPKRDEDLNRIRNSEEYKDQCRRIDEDARLQQEKYDNEYADAKKQYENVVVPGYEREKTEWEEDLKKRIDEAQALLKKSQTELSELYEQTKIIPVQYRSIDALQYVYDVISTSDYSIKEAVEMYEKECQRRLDEERLNEQKVANSLANQQNELLGEQNRIADRARREAAISGVVGTVQHHNTNKILKENFTKKK